MKRTNINFVRCHSVRTRIHSEAVGEGAPPRGLRQLGLPRLVFCIAGLPKAGPRRVQRAAAFALVNGLETLASLLKGQR